MALFPAMGAVLILSFFLSSRTVGAEGFVTDRIFPGITRVDRRRSRVVGIARRGWRPSRAAPTWSRPRTMLGGAPDLPDDRASLGRTHPCLPCRGRAEGTYPARFGGRADSARAMDCSRRR